MSDEKPHDVLDGAENAATKASIVEHFRGRIVRGEMAPGERLPTQRELIRRFGTTAVTLQRAIRVLADQGFISPQGARGTFVAENPPHTSRYALILPDRPQSWNQFHIALREQAMQAEKLYNRKLPVFYDVHLGHHGSWGELLLEDMRAHRLAGVVFTFNPEAVRGAPFMKILNVPMAAIMNQVNELGIPAVKIDYDSFFDQALDYLAQRGHRNVAAMSIPGMTVPHRDLFLKGAAARGLGTRPYWWLPAHVAPNNPGVIHNTMQLLMNTEQPVRPDALIIADDNLVQQALDGLRDAGVRVPDDIEIVAHSNVPASPQPPVPVKRLGYSVHQILETCFELIDRQRHDELVPLLTPITASFEEAHIQQNN